MKAILISILFLIIANISFSQEVKGESYTATYHYAYISIEGKVFSKKLRVEVDFGDSEEQMKMGSEFSQKLTNKKSYAAILNYMVENQFELVETLTLTSSYSGSGGTSGIIFIMRKKK